LEWPKDGVNHDLPKAVGVAVRETPAPAGQGFIGPRLKAEWAAQDIAQLIESNGKLRDAMLEAHSVFASK
jgi:hypothetical protein